MSRRARLGFLAACLLASPVAAVITWGPLPTGPSSKAPPTVTLAPEATQPAGLAVTDLHDLEQLQAVQRRPGDAGGHAGAGSLPEGSVWRAPGGRPRTSFGATRMPGCGSMWSGSSAGRSTPGGRSTGRAWSTQVTICGIPATSSARGFDRFGVTFGGLDYDFFPLFDRDATWGDRAPRPVSSGAMAISESERLADRAAVLLR